jgi:hypothetical protein
VVRHLPFFLRLFSFVYNLYPVGPDGLGFSESSAQRRICAARAIRKCPESYDYLLEDQVSLSTLSIAWKFITRDLLDEITVKSQRQVMTIVARFEPWIKHPDNTRP